MRAARLRVRDWQLWCGYQSSGDPRGTAPLIYVPGGPGMPHHSLLPVSLRTPAHRTHVFYDPTGSGSSDRPTGVRWDLEVFVDELEALTRELHLERFHLFGSSFGGMVCLAYALRQPRGLLSMTLAGASASYPATRAAVRARIASLPPALRDALSPGAAGYQGAQSAAYARAYHEYCALFMCRIPCPPDLSRGVSLANLPVMIEMKGRGLMYDGTLRDVDLNDRLGDIAVPTLLAYGQHDALYPDVAQDLHRRLTGSRLVVFPDSSHIPHLEEEEAFATTLHGFLDELDGPRD
jgi:proline-specific peptidase